jgi:RHS repeat-associated protein
MTLNNSMSITPMPPAKAKGERFEHGSVLGGKTRAARVSSQWKSTGQGHLISTTDPLSRVSQFAYDGIGRMTHAVDPLGATALRAYDPINGPTTVTNGDGQTSTIAYSHTGKIASLTDARGHAITYGYDSSDRLSTITDADSGVAHVTSYDGLGNPLTSVDRKSQTTTYTYDALNRPATVSYADGSSKSFTFDLGGRLTQIQDSVGGTITRGYDGLDRLTSETSPQGTVTYTYDAAGRRSTLQAGSTQAQVSYTYDNDDRLTAITQGSTSLSFGYDTASRRTSASLPNGISATYTWDAASELTAIAYAAGATNLGNVTYAYDLAGRINSRGGSLFQSILPATVTSATYDPANRLTARTAAGVIASPTWDANGSMTSDGTKTYVWDARNRLTAITGLASFVYDGSDRRKTATLNGTATSYLYDGFDVAEEQQGGAASADLLLGLNVDERFSRAGSTLLTDALGSTVGLANSTAVQTQYGYDPYGVAHITGVASTNPYQFTGRENDPTAAGLMYYRARYYNQAWGRFIAEDPIGIQGGTNLYGYVYQDPVNLKDPSGRTPLTGDPWSMWTNGRTCRFFDGNGNADFDIDIPGHHFPMEWHGWYGGVRGPAIPF